MGKLWWKGTGSKQEMEGKAEHVSARWSLFYRVGGPQMQRSDMRLRHMEGQDGVTKSMKVGGWTGPKASRGPFDRARAAETSLVTQTSELLGRTHLLLRTLCTMTGP